MKNHALMIRRGFRCAVLCGLLIGGLAASASAQGFRGGGEGGGGGFGGGTPPSPEDMFKRMDRNQNGQLDPEEIGFMRDMYSRAGIDVSRPISLQEFTQASTKIREQFEQARSSGGGPSSFGGGGPPSFGGGGPPSFGGGGPPSFGGGERRSDESSDRESRREDRDRRGDRDGDRSRDSSSGSGKSSKKVVKPKERVTKVLPEDYRSKDKNGDGQIGLYEWDRSAFAKFYELDRNGDGLLTADELIAATKKPSSSKSSGSKSTAVTTAMPSGSEFPNTAAATTVDAAKPGAAASSAPATPTTPAMKVFIGLDSDNDGKLTEEEWKRSRTAHTKFEKAGIAISFPIQQAQFAELYKKVEAQ